MNKIAFVNILYPNRSPAPRFRYEQFIPFWIENGYSCSLKWILNPEDDFGFYKGNIFHKLWIFIKSTSKLLRIVIQLRQFPIVFIQREAYFLGTTFFERKIATHSKIIYDFDDSIWLPSISESNKKFKFLKNPKKTDELIKMASLVIAGNQHLANYALQFNQNVVVIPTVLDTTKFFPKDKPKTKYITIGWSGSHTTIPHFKTILPVLFSLKQKYQDHIRFKVMGDASYIHKELQIQGISWTSESEVDTIRSFDIGIMPLPDDEWSQGKCGFKGLQYMSLEIPTIMSPVGVNTEIIEDGVNGFLASNEEEWIEKLSLLIDNETLRKSIGKEGRNTIVEKYSLDAWKNTYLDIFNSLL